MSIAYVADLLLEGGGQISSRRICRYCHKKSVGDDHFGGHDYCIKNLPGVAYACCGHGVATSAYVCFDDGVCLYGNAALAAMQMLGGSPPESTSTHLEWLVHIRER